jgi:SAM-dependent methyltransferase
MTANFDGLARWYQVLELSAFGVELERARMAHVGQLADCREVLLLGDGDGRFLKKLLKASPQCRVRSIDASAEMLKMAAARLTSSERARVTFECADALTATLPTFAYDGVATVFFLDCFTDEQARVLIGRIANALRPGGTWVFADFAIPPRGPQRIAAHAIVGLLYAFFRWRTGIAARRLPNSEALISEAGLSVVATKSSVLGLFRSVTFRRS